jgi:hypothetical protein
MIYDIKIILLNLYLKELSNSIILYKICHIFLIKVYFKIYNCLIIWYGWSSNGSYRMSRREKLRGRRHDNSP